MPITYLDGRRFARVVVGGADWVRHTRDQINRINVFPVADGDTGTNMALSLSATAAALRDLDERDLGPAVRTAAEASILGAKGNSGLIMAHWFLGLSRALGERARVGLREFADSLHGATDAVYAALDTPVEGTVVTVMRAVSEHAAARADDVADLAELVHALVEVGREALERTPQQLAVLRDAHVVDAGALGYVNFLEGARRVVRGDPLPEAAAPLFAESAHPPLSEDELDARYCTELIVRGTGFDEADLKQRFAPFGNSLLVATTGELFKLHIHTDHPDELIRVAGRLGHVEERKVDDMLRQREERDHAVAPVIPLDEQPRTVAVVCDSTADLDAGARRSLGIEMVPLQVLFGDRVFRDQVDLDLDGFYDLLRDDPHHPTTSQPPPRAFVEAFDRIRPDRQVLVTTLSATLSGTHKSARTAARLVDHPRVEVFDSGTASLGLGLMARNAARLARRGADMEELLRWLARWREASGLVFAVATLEYLRRGGRIGRASSLIGSLLRLRPVLTLRDGEVVPLARARGDAETVRLVENHLENTLPPDARLRVGLVGIDTDTRLDELEAWLRARWELVECVRSIPTGVIGAHAGPGAWGCFYQVVSDDDPLLEPSG
ncbi:MAG: DegV family protein [Gammaproteobacteria bacterium]|nr:DegV family protein [Gammaproteobacteria bacterium]